jgi:hypothetical protein
MRAGILGLLAAALLFSRASAQTHDPCDHQGITTIVFPAGAADPFGPNLGPHNARAIDSVASSWLTRHSILSVQGHEDGQEALRDPNLAAQRAAAVTAALVQHGVGRHWIRSAANDQARAADAVIAAPDAGVGCLGVPGRYTAQ